jgi:hypothetical protein
MKDNIIAGLLSNALWWVVIATSGLLVTLLNKRRILLRDFSQIFGVYLSFHKRVGRENDDITVNVIHIRERRFLGKVIVEYWNGAKFKDGFISAAYKYSGSIAKTDSEYILSLNCSKLHESLLAIVKTANSSLQLCPFMHMSRDYNLQTYANIGLIVGQEYFINHMQNGDVKRYIDAALEYVSDKSTLPYFIKINKSQHECLEYFREKFGFSYSENITQHSIIKKGTYKKNKINSFGPYINTCDQAVNNLVAH